LSNAFIPGEAGFVRQALLRPEIGFLAIPLSALMMTVWHIPVWYTYAAKPEKYGLPANVRATQLVAGLVTRGAIVSLILGGIFYVTGSILGPILMHYAGNAIGQVATSAAQQSQTKDEQVHQSV
jgi:membrane protease YdiL (CAAX protease family)